MILCKEIFFTAIIIPVIAASGSFTQYFLPTHHKQMEERLSHTEGKDVQWYLEQEHFSGSILSTLRIALVAMCSNKCPFTFQDFVSLKV